MGKKIKKLTDYPIRKCYSMHDCCLCEETIALGQLYFDGGYGNRAHITCVADQDIGKDFIPLESCVRTIIMS